MSSEILAKRVCGAALAATVVFVVSACSQFFGPGIKKEPTAKTNCYQDKSVRNDIHVQGRCSKYVQAKNYYEDGNYEKAKDFLEKSELTKEYEWARAFAKAIDEAAAKKDVEDAQAEADRDKAKTPDPLDAAKVKSLELMTDVDKLCAGGDSIKVAYRVTLEDGATKETWVDSSQKAGFIDYDNFEVNGVGLGIQAYEVQPYIDLGEPARDGYRLKVALKENPSISAEKVFEQTYGCLSDKWLRFNGQDGGDGENGPDNVPGSVGQPGGPGPDVEVHVGYIQPKGGEKLIVVRARGEGTKWVVVPAKALEGKIQVESKGGKGGRGGSGGRGDDPQVGGNGGDGGNGGAIQIFYDKRHKELGKLVVGKSLPGEAGTGGEGGDAGISWGETGKEGKPGRVAKPKAVDKSQLFDNALLELI